MPPEPSQPGSPRSGPRAQPKRPAPAPTGPDGQPIVVRQGTHGRGLVIGLALVLGIAALVVFNLAKTASDHPEKVQLGNNVLDLSRNADKYAERIDRTGPRLFQSLLGDRDLWVNHVGGRWAAFKAVPDGQPRNCPVGWDGTRMLFVDPCRDAITYPADGTGLQHYQVIEGNGRLAVDLKTPSAWPPVPVTTTSTIPRLPQK